MVENIDGNLIKSLTITLMLLLLTAAPIFGQDQNGPPDLLHPPTGSGPKIHTTPIFKPKPAEPEPSLYGTILKNISVSKDAFNPGLDEETALLFTLTEPAKVTCRVYDPDHGLIRQLCKEKAFDAGKHTLLWDGTDSAGRIVPDEAYFFTLTAVDEQGDEEIYDPTAFSGGVEHSLKKADIDTRTGTITYRMPETGRVMIRMGIEGGPLLNQLVDWEPRLKGMVTEYWNGKDKDNQIDIHDHPKFKMIIAYFTLPENSIITFGNKTESFRAYKRSITEKWPVKPNRARSDIRLSRHYRLSRMVDFTPRLTIDFSNLQGTDPDGTLLLKGKTLVSVELAEEAKAVFQNQQFEICFFLDHQFLAEDEVGYTPFNWGWNLYGVEEGEHLLTVNVSSFQDQIGVISRKIKVIQ